MTPVFILLLFCQCCCVSGQFPGYNLSPLANLALKVAVGEVNKQPSRFNLHRPTSTAVRQITQVRDNMYDILLDFGIKETVCRKNTRTAYLDRCRFSPGRFASKESCSSLVRVSSMSAAPLRISCITYGALGSSSESSSEEFFNRGIRRVPGFHFRSHSVSGRV